MKLGLTYFSISLLAARLLLHTVAAANVFQQGFENGLGDWTIEGGLWQVGPPKAANGPAAFAGTNIVGTGLTNNYGATHDARLITAQFVVPAASESPRFTYHYWYLIGVNDYGQLQIRTNGIDWIDIPGERLTEASGGSWARRSVDLRAYAGQNLQLAFRLFTRANNSAGDLALGWFIDEAALETGPTQLPSLESPQTFENGFGDWSVEGGVWQVGRPTGAGGPAAFAGTNVAGTILGGIYGTTHDARLITPEFVVPAADQLPRLTYHYWYAVGGLDYGQLQVRIVGGEWQDVPGEHLTEAHGSSWARRSVDLRSFAGQSVQLAFRLVSQYQNRVGDLGLGWYIDNVALETGPMKMEPTESFENGFADWSVEGGLWQVGIPSGAGAPNVLDGTNVVGTILGGIYGTTHDARLVTPEFTVPAADQSPRLSYFYWYSIGGFDYGQLEIREPGGAWVEIPGERLTEHGGAWSRRSVDLRSYARKPVQIAFRLVSEYQNRVGDLALGWYIDRVSLETGPHSLTTSAGFESGFGDWSAEGGLWQVGTPSGAGAPSSFAGTNVAGTILNGNYGTTHDARLVSPEFVVPAGGNPRFSYQYWYDFGFLDYGQLQIRVIGGEWQDIAGERLADRGFAWGRRVVDLRSYAGQNVQIAFRAVTGFENRGGDVGRGWFIDNFALETGPALFRALEDFENGFGDWSAEGGVWQIGVASGASAPRAVSGINVAGTILSGNYPVNANARLVTSEFVIPPALRSPELSFLSWRALQANDIGRVELSVRGGPWVVISTNFTLTDTTWRRSAVNLSGFAGLPARVAWHFTSDAFASSLGWYIDDVRLGTVEPIALTSGVATDGTFDIAGARALYSLEVPAGGNVRFGFDDLDNAGQNELYVKRGFVPTAGSFDFRAVSTNADQTVFAPNAAAGTYYVMVIASTVPTNGSLYRIRADFSTGIAISSVTPARVGNSKPAIFDVKGSGFNPLTQVTLRVGNTITATAVTTFVSADRLLAELNLPNVPFGDYDLTVSEGTNVASIPVEIIPGGQPQLETHLVLPGRFGRHAPATIFIDYANTGDVAMPAPILVLHGTERALLTLDSALSARGLWTAARPEGFSDTIQVLASGATPGVLQPGERRRVPVYYAGLLQPWDFTRTSVGLRFGTLQVSNTALLDWNGYKAALRPNRFSVEAWDVIWSNLAAATGPTWGNYSARIAQTAEYLGKLGFNVTDLRELLAFQLAQADALNPVGTLAAATDVASGAPGLSLVFSRAYPQLIHQRYRLGPLGRGWSHNWETALTTRPDGTIVISVPNGKDRLFQRDVRGGFFSRLDDFATLTRLNNGSYELRERNGVKTAFGADGRFDYVEDLNGNRIAAQYTGEFLTRLDHSAGLSLQLNYNSSGLLESVVDPYGRSTRFAFDSSQHLVSATRYETEATSYSYVSGQGAAREHALKSVTHPGALEDQFTYDSLGRLLTLSKSCCTEQISFAYDSAGSIRALDALTNEWKIFYNQRGLLSKFQNPLGYTTRYLYDRNFFPIGMEKADGSLWSHALDRFGRATRMTDPLGNSVELAYGANSRLERLTDARGYSYLTSFDADGNARSFTYPDGSQETYDYDLHGGLVSFTNRRGQTTSLTRDSAGRVLRKTTAEGRTNEFLFDARGNLISISDSLLGLTSLTYNSRDQLANLAYPGGARFDFDYDAARRRVSRTSSDGYALKYFYNSAGRLEHLEDVSGRSIVQYQFDPAGRLIRETKGNGTATTYQYDPANQLLALVNYSPESTPVSRFEYSYDPVGNRIALVTAKDSFTYKYDTIGQLIEAASDGRRVSYAYDPSGNRSSVRENGVETRYTANALNQYTHVGNILFNYDADGNLTNRTDPSGTRSYDYDSEGRLVHSRVPVLGDSSYTYDVSGNLVSITQNGTSIGRVYDPIGLNDLVAEYANGILLARYDHGFGLIDRADSSTNRSYYNFDAIGNARELTGPAGTIQNTYEYDPFGALVAAQETVDNPFTFIGRAGVATADSGGYQMRHRWYDADTGRFQSADPIGFNGGVNLYQYAGNSPNSQIDPSGLESFTLSGPLKALSVGIGLNPDGSFYFLFGSGLGGGAYVVRDQSGQLLNLTVDALLIGASRDFRPVESGCSFSAVIFGHNTDEIPYQVQHQPAPTYTESFAAASGGIECAIKLWDPQATDDLKWLVDELRDSILSGIENLEQKVVDFIASFDPNEIIGPAGYGSPNFLAANSTLPYRINFQNATNATAPAQMVMMTNNISTNLDLSTLEFTTVGFGDYLFEVPAGSRHFEQTARVSFNDTEFEINIEAKIDYVDRQVIARFDSIMPDTGLPPTVDIGFLPPEDGTGRGNGHVAYTVRPKSDLPTGTAIRNVGLITFDPFAGGPTFRTDLTDPLNPNSPPNPERQALVTIDADPPTATVSALPANSGPAVSVTWGGTDLGAGIDTYDVYVRTDNGDWTLWQDNTTQASGVWNGVAGHTYAFYAAATDGVGLTQNVPTSATAAQATTSVAGLVNYFRSITANQQTLELEFTALPQEQWIIQRAPSLNGPWQDFSPITIDVTGSARFSDALPSQNATFYRALRQ